MFNDKHYLVFITVIITHNCHYRIRVYRVRLHAVGQAHEQGLQLASTWAWQHLGTTVTYGSLSLSLSLHLSLPLSMYIYIYIYIHIIV